MSLSKCSQIMMACGYHTNTTSYELNPNRDRYYRITNWANALGYFPILGTITGCMRICIASFRLSQEKDSAFFFKVQIIRGSVEALSLGFLFIIPDLIMTFGRLCFGCNVLHPNRSQKIY